MNDKNVKPFTHAFKSVFKKRPKKKRTPYIGSLGAITMIEKSQQMIP
jgi:hypothetical protein